jgi:2-oxoglutarate ferredoxin oxidoreductase subunit alpha
MYDLTVTAVNFSESLRNPVIILSDEIISHMYEKIELPSPESLTLLQRPQPKKDPSSKYLPFFTNSPQEVPAVANFGEGFHFNVTGLIHDLNGFPVSTPEKTGALLYRLHEKINSRMKTICLFDKENTDADIILCSFGASARSCAQAIEDVAKEGIKVGFIKLKTLWPFPDFIFDDLCGKNKTVVVCEMNMGQVIGEVRRVANGRFDVAGINSVDGTMITPRTIVKRIKELAHAG